MTEEKKPNQIEIDDQTVVLNGQRKVLLYRASDFPVKEAVGGSMIRVKNPKLKVIFFRWYFAGLSNVSFKIVVVIIKLLALADFFFRLIKDLLKAISPIEIRVTSEEVKDSQHE